MGLLADAFVYLVAAVVAVPVARQLGLGSVLGYLIAGVIIGPVTGIVGAEATEVQHFAEFGVVMMMFVIGLELRPSMLWEMRRQLVGLGGLQISITLAAVAAIAFAACLPWQGALAVGMILALSSTAIVLQTLNEKAWLKTTGGQSSFAVLLTQDIAVIPMIAVMPLLALPGLQGSEAADHGGSLLSPLPGWAQALIIIAAIAGIIVAGRFLLRPLFRFIAATRLREIFTATALMLVIGIALLMNMVGLSAALGTFLAGVVLSDSEFRHELESDIEPFKGLLLGLFFLTVGAGIDFALLFGDPVLIVGLALGVMALKLIILLVLAVIFRLKGADRWLFALGLAQAGEFAFVLFGFALSAGALAPDLIRTLTLVVAISMLLTPLLFILYEKLIVPRSGKSGKRAADDIEETGTVVIAGMGRYGQIISRLLTTNGYSVIVLDHDAEAIERLRRIGMRTYYGDATRPDLLAAAGLGEADLFIAALDEREKQITLVEHVSRTYPGLPILARARDRHHVYELEKAGAHLATREVFEGALRLGRSALETLGSHPFLAETKVRTFRRHDVKMLRELQDNWNDGGVDQTYIDAMRAQFDTMADLMQTDRGERHAGAERGWVAPPRREETIRKGEAEREENGK
ncbi:monovalent cation:proton antiporter-2 (CPA2) family protein [Minwuia sp.]|uniref:monovalent cation:proton antiporter-2 (CPA2) family protein n=1 Tax=Minwuia sp. TaxID=2493630 RepID=UPI003A8CD6CC